MISANYGGAGAEFSLTYTTRKGAGFESRNQHFFQKNGLSRVELDVEWTTGCTYLLEVDPATESTSL